MNPHKLNIAFTVSVLIIAVGALAYLAYQRTDSGAIGAVQTPKTVGEILAAYNQNDLMAAMRGIDAQLAADPRDVRALIAKAEVLAQQGSLTFDERTYGPQAIALAQQALAIDSNSSEAWRVIGYAHEIQQEYPQAHDAYAQALLLDSSNVAAISGDAHTYDLQGQVQQAADGYYKALSLDPTLMHARMGYARMLQALGNSSAAQEQFGIVASHADNIRQKAEAEFSGGVLSRDAGDRAAAELLFSRATEDDPSYSLGFVGLAGEEFFRATATTTTMPADDRRALMKSSFQHLETALTLNPNQTLAAFQLGVQLIAIDQKDAARTDFTRLLDIVPLDITLAANDKDRILNQVKLYLAALTAGPTSAVMPEGQAAAAGTWCFVDACIFGGGNETYQLPALDAALASYDFAHATSLQFFKDVNQLAIDKGFASGGVTGSLNGFGFPLALACDNGSPLFQYMVRGGFDPSALPPPNVPVTPTTPAGGGGGGGGGTPASSCTPAYTCSGTTITHRSATCAITTVSTCAAPAICQSGVSTCVYPSMAPATFAATYDGVSGSVSVHTALSLDGHLHAYPALVQKGTTARLYWNVTNAATCAVSSPAGTLSTLRSSGAAGVETPTISSQTVFTLHCTGLPHASPAALDEHATVSIIPVFQEQ